MSILVILYELINQFVDNMEGKSLFIINMDDNYVKMILSIPS